eukprot:TRINITY_DN5311_c9_g1_i1.p1 TRINITY_DN5311_c9_g1~~TRINITY_DN5311_c9_g1_i1.p1  ORF type:complete len:402 (+),score=100.44 TRINITY_DN5311_c9_g1_i1:1489-2694(+)
MSGRSEPLSIEEWQTFFEQDGRIVNENKLRARIFKGGVDPAIRKDVWYFLLGYYPMHSTTREREVLQRERRMEYLALKQHWQEELEPEKYEHEDFDVADNLGEEDQFVFVQAKLKAMRHEIDPEKAEDSIRIIRKDVPRTDRQNEYFEADDNIHLVWLNDILVTYAVYHQEVGYVQGMNDVLAMILNVMDHEADAYWCFATYLDTIQADFMAKGMVSKIVRLKKLVTFMEEDLMQHLIAVDAGEMIYCHRWLLLGFKREFVWEDSLRLFEILCSHHLELNNVEVDKVRAEELRKERERLLSADVTEPNTDVANVSMDRVADEEDFTFELFVSTAILQQQREQILACKDMADVFQLINGLTEKMDLDDVLHQSERVFFEYCRRSVSSSTAATAHLLKKDGDE